MRRQRRPLILLCLLALVWCQTAMAARWCDGSAARADSAMVDCHGSVQGGSDAGNAHCPGGDVVPDLAKLPCIAALPSGHDFSLSVSPRECGLGAPDRFALPRDGPSLDALCRLLI